MSLATLQVVIDKSYEQGVGCRKERNARDVKKANDQAWIWYDIGTKI